MAANVSEKVVSTLASVYDGDEERAREVLDALEAAGIIDAQGNSPLVKCLVNVGESRFAPVRDSERSQEAEPNPKGQGPASVFDNAGPLASACIYEALNSGREPDPADVLRYNAWKRAFQAEVFRCAGW